MEALNSSGRIRERILAERYHVIAVAAILIFKDSQPVKRLLGFQDRRSLRTLLNSVASESDRLPLQKIGNN